MEGSPPPAVSPLKVIRGDSMPRPPGQSRSSGQQALAQPEAQRSGAKERSGTKEGSGAKEGARKAGARAREEARREAAQAALTEALEDGAALEEASALRCERREEEGGREQRVSYLTAAVALLHTACAEADEALCSARAEAAHRLREAQEVRHACWTGLGAGVGAGVGVGGVHALPAGVALGAVREYDRAERGGAGGHQDCNHV